MGTVVDLDQSFVKTFPNGPVKGVVIGHEDMTVTYRTQPLRYTVAAVAFDLPGRGKRIGMLVIPGHYEDLDGRTFEGRAYQNRSEYFNLLGQSNPIGSFIHAHMIHNNAVYIDPLSATIEGIAPPRDAILDQKRRISPVSWISGLIRH